jgi:hypothetical protein
VDPIDLNPVARAPGHCGEIGDRPILSRKQSRFWAIAAILTTVLCGAALPMWSDWHFSHATTSNLFSVLLTTLDNWEHVGSTVFAYNFVTLAFLLCISGVIGWLVFHCLRNPSMEWFCSLTMAVCLAITIGLFASKASADGFAWAVVVVALYAVLLVIEIVLVDFFSFEDESRPSGEVVDRLLPLKTEGKLLARGLNRIRKKHRTPVIVETQESEAEEGLSRLLEVKRNVFPDRKGNEIQAETGEPTTQVGGSPLP